MIAVAECSLSVRRHMLDSITRATEWFFVVRWGGFGIREASEIMWMVVMVAQDACVVVASDVPACLVAKESASTRKWCNCAHGISRWCLCSISSAYTTFLCILNT